MKEMYKTSWHHKYRHNLISLYKLSALFDFFLFCCLYFIVLFWLFREFHFGFGTYAALPYTALSPQTFVHMTRSFRRDVTAKLSLRQTNI